MTKKSSTFLILLLIWSVISWYWYVCKIKHHCDEIKTTTETTTVAETTTPQVQTTGFFVQDGNYTVEDEENISFLQSDARPRIPSAINSKLRDLINYLQTSRKQIHLEGLYSADETYTGKFENLGIARAEGLKGRLITLGLNPAWITTSGKLDNSLKFNENSVVLGAINYTLNALNITENDEYNKEDRLRAVEANLRAKPLMLYFDTGEASLAFDPETENYVGELNYYLLHKENSKVNITGHTDNVGNKDANYQLGLDRAKFVQNYFLSLGINAAQTNVSSKGPDQPIADNATEEGRAKNRRVEIAIQ
ncbi:MAG: OmpA family protein [Chitinophagales bacterium]|nr:OmpA family protein [Bacteroidota bacterium]MCB9044070.1 OmpA family protein [Chitinophagales bacterium]